MSNPKEQSDEYQERHRRAFDSVFGKPKRGSPASLLFVLAIFAAVLWLSGFMTAKVLW